jgi:hypothetical protein
MAKLTAKEVEQLALDGHVLRGRRCANCKHFKSGEGVYQAILRENPEFQPLEAYPELRRSGIVKNPGVVDMLLRAVKERRAGECAVDREARVIAQGFYCRSWDGVAGIREDFKTNEDLLPEEVAQIRKERTV